jgi:hypothetical protein
MVSRLVYASMASENQTVSIECLEALYAQTEPAPALTPGGAVELEVFLRYSPSVCTVEWYLYYSFNTSSEVLFSDT